MKRRDSGMKDLREDRYGGGGSSSSIARKPMPSPSVEETFPWLVEFRARCKTSLDTRDPGSLLRLMRFFSRNVSSSVAECYKKSSRAAKLKELIKEAMLLFMYFHRFQRSQGERSRTGDASPSSRLYLGQMSDLLARYVDLELVASKREAKAAHAEISARLVSCLSVYLENSTEHLLDTLMKIQLMSESHSDILDSVIAKVFKIVPSHPDASGLMYLRYLLVFRLWRKIHSLLPVKKQIYARAMRSLPSVPPADLPRTVLELILATPAAATSATPETNFYLCQQFDLRRACSRFLEHCQGDEDPGYVENEADVRAPVFVAPSRPADAPDAGATERDPRVLRLRQIRQG